MTKATVAAIITPPDNTEGNIILLTRRTVSPFKEHWCLPGGHIDQLESAEAAVVREVKEETGLLYASPAFLLYCDEIFPEYNFHAVALVFQGPGIGTPVVMPDEVDSIGWFTLEEAAAIPLAFNHRHILEQYARLLLT